jgi:hypothetical protein
MGRGVRRREDDDRIALPTNPPLSHPRNRKRQLPLQEQLGESRQNRKGAISQLDERLTLKPSSTRESSMEIPGQISPEIDSISTCSAAGHRLRLLLCRLTERR